LGMPNSDIRIALIQLILNDVKNDGLESQHRYIQMDATPTAFTGML
jgi:hypothetical protein